MHRLVFLQASICFLLPLSLLRPMPYRKTDIHNMYMKPGHDSLLPITVLLRSFNASH